jgi:DNA-directed RNA polymerase subunit RPC12/RpoP
MLNCPDCGSSFTRRIPRTPLMRLLPTASHILCNHCGERSLVLFPQLARVKAERPIVRPAQHRRSVV